MFRRTALLILGLLLAPVTLALAGDDPFGVAILPRTGKFADTAEQTMYGQMGQYDQIDTVHAADKVDDVLLVLDRYRRAGKKIDVLILGGHGPRPGVDDPGILLGSERITPESMDIRGQRAELRRLKWELERVDRKAKEEGTVEFLQKGSHLRNEIRAVEKRLTLLETAKEAMAPGALLWLLNCNALQSRNGEAFVRSLGEVFLSRRGGNVVASQTDVQLGNSITRFLRDFAGEDWKAIPKDGKWKYREVHANWFWLVAPDHPWAKERTKTLLEKGKKLKFHFQSAVYGNTYFFDGPDGLLRVTGSNVCHVDWELFKELHEMLDSGPADDREKHTRWEKWRHKKGGDPIWIIYWK